MEKRDYSNVIFMEEYRLRRESGALRAPTDSQLVKALHERIARAFHLHKNGMPLEDMRKNTVDPKKTI